MSDLVGNPEDRFSHNEAHIIFFSPYKPIMAGLLLIFCEHHEEKKKFPLAMTKTSEKTCLWGFQLSMTQTGLYNNRGLLEA